MPWIIDDELAWEIMNENLKRYLAKITRLVIVIGNTREIDESNVSLSHSLQDDSKTLKLFVAKTFEGEE